MAFAALPTLQKNSLPTTTTTDMTTGSLSVEVTEQAVFYRAGVLLTKGWVLGPDNAVEFRTEEVIVSATDGTSGPGTVTFSTRAVKADGTNGAAYAWPAGTRIRNTLTTSVADQIKDNFTECFLRDGSVAFTGYAYYRDVDDSRLIFYGGTAVAGHGAQFIVRGSDYPATGGYFQVYVPNAAKNNIITGMQITGVTDTPIVTFCTLKHGATSVADGGTITHGVGTTPTTVICTPTVSGEMVSVTATGATTFTVAIKKHDGSAGTTQTVHWMAWL